MRLVLVKCRVTTISHLELFGTSRIDTNHLSTDFIELRVGIRPKSVVTGSSFAIAIMEYHSFAC